MLEIAPEIPATEVAGDDNQQHVENPAPAAEQAEAAANPEGQQPESEKSEADSRPEKPKRDGGFQRRIDELTRRNHEQQRMLDRALEALAQKAGSSAVPSDAKQEDAPPTRDQFDDYESFINAKARYEATKAVRDELSRGERERERAAQEAKAAAEQSSISERIDSLKERGRDKYEDFDEVALGEVPITEAMGEAIALSDIGEDISYYLGKNPSVAERIAGLRPLAAAREIGVIEASLRNKPGSKAPAPARPVNGGGSNQRDLARMSVAEIAASLKKQDPRWFR